MEKNAYREIHISCTVRYSVQYTVASTLQGKSIYVFLFWELRGLSPNFHIHVLLSDLYIPRIGPPIFPAAEQQTDLGNI